MPLPTDKVKSERTFRKCAGDPVGTHYHQSAFLMHGFGVVFLSIRRGVESLEVQLSFPSAESRKAAQKNGPVFHGADLTVSLQGLGWTYDKFGDCVFSSLRSGAYRDAGAKEWSVQDVLTDCVDEVRRILGLVPEVERPAPPPAMATTFGKAKRRILR
jgi:hypothetical protein